MENLDICNFNSIILYMETLTKDIESKLTCSEASKESISSCHHSSIDPIILNNSQIAIGNWFDFSPPIREIDLLSPNLCPTARISHCKILEDLKFDLLYCKWFNERLQSVVESTTLELEASKQEKEALASENQSLKDTVIDLKAKLAQDSTTSSSPGSRDIAKKRYPPKPSEPSEKKQGGQPGHGRHTREPIKLEDATSITRGELKEEERICPYCGGRLERDPDKDKQFDHYDLPPIVIQRLVTIAYSYRCESCGKSHLNVPEHVADAGLVSHSILSLFAVFKIGYHQSVRSLQKLFDTLFHETFSTSYIDGCLKDVSAVMRPIYLELVDDLVNHEVSNIDETGHRFLGKRLYTWGMMTNISRVFAIGTRSSHLLEVIFGDDYKGIIGSDCHGSYLKFVKTRPDIKLQLCLAHLIRDFKFCATYLKPDVESYGKRNLSLLTEVFEIYHKRHEIKDKDSEMAAELTAKLHDIKDAFIKSALDIPPNCDKASALAKRIKKCGHYYFTFIDNDAVAPTNNVAEQGLRPIVIDRKITIGTQSFDGISFCETMWTISETTKLLNIDLNTFIIEALNASKEGRPLPSLVNIGGFVDSKYVEMAKKHEQELIAKKAETKRIKEERAAEKAAKLEADKKAAANLENEVKPETELPKNKKTASKGKILPAPVKDSNTSSGTESLDHIDPPDHPDSSPPDVEEKIEPDGLSEEGKKPTLSPTEQSKQQELLRNIINGFRASESAKTPLKRGRKPKDQSSMPCSEATPTLKSHAPTAHRRIEAPEPFIAALEPAPMGLSINSL
jgi:transposase